MGVQGALVLNEVTSRDGGWRVLFAFGAQWPVTAEFLRWAESGAM